MSKLIGYARVSTRQQSTDRQRADLLAAGVRPDDLYIDHGVSGARASRPEFDRALDALIQGIPSSSRLWTGSGGPPKTCLPSRMNPAAGALACAC
jgi:DNA invertase Pin-like site-specific DNA recombinase